MTLQAMCFQAVPASQVMILGQNAPKSSPKCPKIITWLAADCFKCVPGLQPTASNVCLHIFWTSHLRVRIPYAVDALVHLKRSSRPSLHLLPFCLDMGCMCKACKTAGRQCAGHQGFPPDVTASLIRSVPQLPRLYRARIPANSLPGCPQPLFTQYPPSTATHNAHISRNPASFN